MARLRKDDLVVVTTGRDKGTQGRILKVLTEVDRVIVEGVNVVRRHQRPTPRNPEGGILEKEAPIHISNVMLLDSKTDKPTRVRYGRNDDGDKIRISVRSGEALDG
jgi:large subunit ribosomal protein L24